MLVTFGNTSGHTWSPLVTQGLMFGTIYGCYGLGLWYGVKIIKDEEQTPEFENCTMSCVGSGIGGAAGIAEIQVR